jgi:hypothetical protein
MADGQTYRTANFLGRKTKTGVGISMKQMTNMMTAAMLRPAKTSRRSHRLTVPVQEEEKVSNHNLFLDESEAWKGGKNAKACKFHALPTRRMQELDV